MIRIDRRGFLAGAAGSLALPAVASAGASARPDLPAIASSIAAEAQSELKLKGLAIGVLAPGGEHVAGAGDTGRGTVPDGSTVFGIGSITKTFTTLTLARAVDEGMVAYDDPVARHLPDGFDVPTGGGREITLEHLATQTSGLPRLPAGMEKLPGFDPRDPYAALTVDRLARLLRGGARRRRARPEGQPDPRLASPGARGRRGAVRHRERPPHVPAGAPPAAPRTDGGGAADRPHASRAGRREDPDRPGVVHEPVDAAGIATLRALAEAS